MSMQPRERILLLAQRSSAPTPDDYDELMAWIADRVAEIDDLPAGSRDRVLALLDGIDLLHRHGLSRFVDRVRILGGRGMLERLTEDPDVRTLLELYDLGPDDEAREAAGAARRTGLVQIGDLTDPGAKGS